MRPLLVLVLTTLVAATLGSPEPRPTSDTTSPRAATPSRAHTGFVQNLGQWPERERFRARFDSCAVELGRRGWSIQARGEADADGRAHGVVVAMEFEGQQVQEPVPERQLGGHHNYFLGDDPTRWRSRVPIFASVRYPEVVPGVDVRVREEEGRFEFDLILEPKADLAAFRIRIGGTRGLTIGRDGDLEMSTAIGTLRMSAPRSWEVGPGGEIAPIQCRFLLDSPTRVGFAAPARREGWTLVIDPGLVWSTYLGGSGVDTAEAVRVAPGGIATVSGQTISPNFPTTPGAYDTSQLGGLDVFVTRLAADGASLLWSTFVGGTNGEFGRCLEVAASGECTVAGRTSSADFPTTPGAFDTQHSANGFDAFVLRLSADGSALRFSTFLGGSGGDAVYGLAVDGNGSCFVTGETASSDLPTTPAAFDRTFGGGTFDGFAAKFSSDGASLLYATYLGGAASDRALALALRADGSAAIVGETSSADFPTTPGCFDASLTGSGDAFLLQLAPSGSTLGSSTYLGGSLSETATAVALGPDGSILLTGNTISSDFPTTPGAFDTLLQNRDAFVVRFNPAANALVFATFLGTTAIDEGLAIVVDAAGAPLVAGTTGSSFPTTPGAFDTTWNLGADGFLARLSQDGTKLEYATYLGGTGNDTILGIAQDLSGIVTVVGQTSSSDFPTTPGAFDTTIGNIFNTDGFVTRLDLLPEGITRLGTSSPGCAGPPLLAASPQPRVGTPTFAVRSANLAPLAAGVAVFANRVANAPIQVLGVDFWLDPTPPGLVSVAVSADSRGVSHLALPIPALPSLVGQSLALQFFWQGPSTPPPCPPQGFSGSEVLRILVQP